MTLTSIKVIIILSLHRCFFWPNMVAIAHNLPHLTSDDLWPPSRSSSFLACIRARQKFWVNPIIIPPPNSHFFQLKNQWVYTRLTTVNIILQSLYMHVPKKRFTGMHTQWSQSCPDITAKLKSYRLYADVVTLQKYHQSCQIHLPRQACLCLWHNHSLFLQIHARRI